MGRRRKGRCVCLCAAVLCSAAASGEDEEGEEDGGVLCTGAGGPLGMGDEGMYVRQVRCFVLVVAGLWAPRPWGWRLSAGADPPGCENVSN